MFGMGFTEILIIAVIAILFLGPDKLPSTMVEIAKFFRSVKNTVGSVKQSIEEEMHVADIKQEALAYKNELLNATNSATASLNSATNIEDLINSETPKKRPPLQKEEVIEEIKQESTPKNQEVTFKKKKKKSIDV
jgi:sec-independent protein translocase protein TatB